MNKADLIASLKKKPVPVEVNGTALFLKPLSVAQKESFALWRKDNPSGAGVVARLIAASLCEEDGTLLLTHPDEANDLDGALADVLCEKIMDLNGMRAPEAGKASSPGTPN